MMINYKLVYHICTIFWIIKIIYFMIIIYSDSFILVVLCFDVIKSIIMYILCVVYYVFA